MNILIITNYFFPTANVASYRMDAFAKYLTEAGHKIIVVTEGVRSETVELDKVTVHYVHEPFSLSRFHFKLGEPRVFHNFKALANIILSQLIIDPKLVWRRRAIKIVRYLLEKKKIDIVLSSFGEVSPHKIVLKILEENFCFKWIADMRDEMSRRPGIHRLLKYRLEYLERKILAKADLVTSVSKPLIHEFSELAGHERFLELRNGYDYPEVTKVNFGSFFTLLYTGNFYGEIKPDNLFAALSELIEEELLPRDIRFIILGNRAPISVPLVLRDIVKELPPVSHAEAITALQQADVLLVIHPSTRPGVFTGKVFDYLPSNKIILSFTNPTDVVGELLRETHAGFTVANEDIAGIKEILLKCYELWKAKIVLPRNWDKIKCNRRSEQVKKLVEYIETHWKK